MGLAALKALPLAFGFFSLEVLKKDLD